MKISEIFYSIQGEGIYQGLPTVFVRLQGCNLLNHCSYCDTSYAWDGSKGTEITTEAVVDRCVQLQPRTYRQWVCITGGEPLFQLGALHEVVKKLSSFGFQVEVETNGSIKKPFWWTLVDSWVFDIKCPSSGVCGVSYEEDWFNTRFCDQAKFVVGNGEDLEFARKVIMRNAARSPIVLVSPVTGILVDKAAGKIEEYWNKEWLREVAEFCKELRVRYSLQLHKIVWGNKKGV